MTAADIRRQMQVLDRQSAREEHLVERCDIWRTYADDQDNRAAPIENPAKVGSRVPCLVVTAPRPPTLDESFDQLHHSLETSVYVPVGTDVLSGDEIRVQASEDYPDYPKRSFDVEQTEEAQQGWRVLLRVHVKPRR